MPDRSGGPSDSPENLDIVLGWMQKNLDDLKVATQRVQELSVHPILQAEALPDPAAIPAALGPATAGGPQSAPSTNMSSGTAAAPDMSAIESAARDVSAIESAAPSLSAPGPAVDPEPGAAHAPAAGAAPATPASASPTPLLDKLGRDLTKLAQEGSLSPIIGRQAETEWIIEVLCRDTKRNPVLLGPAGVGKTAIVEGLAQRIAAGNVPAPLKGARIIEVPLAGLVAGTQYRGQMEERLAQLVAEASRPGIILFFDEIHLLAGAGRTEGGMGAGEALKPALSRGDIAVIGATTPEDYRASIEPDAALARRFTTVAVSELDKDACRPILRAVRDAVAKSRGVTVSDDAIDVLLDFADAQILNRRFPDKAIDLLEQAVAHAILAGLTTVDRDAAAEATVLWAARASSTPTLDRFGRNLVDLAHQGRLGPIVGRERETDAIIEVLLRKTKRNPLLIGPAGSGKTAIVEGLAIRIADGRVPGALKDAHIFDVPLLSLAQGVAAEPSLLADFLTEARHSSIVVFFDEIHQLASAAVKNLAESLKPALARGDISCIGATTGEEYQANLESETALARRFTQIPIEPMDETAVHGVLLAVRDTLARLRGVQVTDDALAELISLAEQFLPNRSFPDKGVDVIEQSVAYALTHGATTVDVEVARAAVAAMVGMPLDRTAPLAALEATVTAGALLDAASLAALLARLRVSLRGLDARARRPDAVVLLCGSAAAGADPLAESIARTVFGRETAVIAIDLSGLTDDSSISTLLGSAPGLVGSDRPLPLHALRRSPWQVVLFRGIDRCAASIRDTIASGLASGSFSDAMGRLIPLGAAIVLMTAPDIDAGGDVAGRALLAAALGPGLIAATDVVAGAGAVVAPNERAEWIRRELLAPLAKRFAREGYDLAFEPAFVTWLGDRLPTDGETPESYLDRAVTPLLAAALPAPPCRLVARIEDGGPVLRPPDGTGDDAAPGPAATHRDAATHADAATQRGRLPGP